MGTITKTTTGSLCLMALNHCGDYAGKFMEHAYDILSQGIDLPKIEINNWFDIMYDRNGNVYAIWAEKPLCYFEADAIYVQLDYRDCPEAFEGMDEKRNN